MASGKCTCSRRSRSVLLFLSLLLVPVLTGPALPPPCVTHCAEISIGKLERLLVEGDVILRYGNGFWSPLCRDVSSREKRFSHAGIVVSGHDGLGVIHASGGEFTGSGAVSHEPLEAFLASAIDYSVYRIDNERVSGKRIAGNAAALIGRPFDRAFDLDDGGRRMYCTELVRDAVNNAAGFTVIGTTSVHGTAIVAPDDCYAHALFRKVADKTTFQGTGG
ncbi:hypothetical protein CHL67_00745 [Prosthecochloris sp. GSB1]|nr:hypothetical protein CHL67_00745 [Prosthecochloris sp. GSB1]